jgi:hypothetical protein
MHAVEKEGIDGRDMTVSTKRSPVDLPRPQSGQEAKLEQWSKAKRPGSQPGGERNGMGGGNYDWPTADDVQNGH